MHVLHVTAGKLYGGIETYLATLARLRHLGGMDPSFAVCFDGRLSEELERSEVRVHRLGPVRVSRPWSAWRARRRFAEVLRQQRPDVVVCHECWPHALFAPVVRKYRLPLVFAAHGTHQGRHWVERWASWAPPDLMLANSRVTQATLSTLFPAAPTALAYLPVEAPVLRDREEVRRRVRQSLGAPTDAVVLLMACRMEAWKGHAILLGALHRMADLPGWVAWIAGGAQRAEEQAYLNELRHQAGELERTGVVRFLGQRGDVAELMTAADIHCQPNTGPEPFGIAFVEALYAGLPVVSTAIGGACEIIDESCGVLVPPGDVVALADALRRLITDAARRSELGRRGPERAADLCEPARQLGALEAALQGVLGKQTAVA